MSLGYTSTVRYSDTEMENSTPKLVPNVHSIKSESHFESNHLVPQLNVFQGAAIIAGAMIGTGVYATPSSVLGLLQATGTSLLVWLGGAVVSLIGAMCYAEWGCRITESGGDAPFLDHVFTKPKKLIPIIYTWVRILVINPGYSASSAYLIGSMFSDILPKFFAENSLWNDWTQKFIGVGILIFETLLCIPSNKLAGKINLVVTLISVMCLTCIIFIAFLLLCKTFPGVIFSNFSKEHLFQTTTSSPSKWAISIYNVMWAYDGWFNLASCLGELKRPEKNIFRSTLLGLGVTAVLFLFVNIAFLLGLPYEKFVGADIQLPQLWATELFGASGEYYIVSLYSMTIAACLFNTLFSSSRIAQAAGEANLILFSKFMSRLSPRFGTPLNALCVNLLFSSILLLSVGKNGFDFIILIVSYPVWLFITLTLIGLIYVKFKEGALWKRPKYLNIPVWINVLGPSIVVVLGIFLLIFPFFDSFDSKLASGVALALVASGFLPYLWMTYCSKRAFVLRCFPF